MKLIKISELFEITYGNQFDINKMEILDDSEINFISRSSQNMGIVAKVERFNDKEPFQEGLITVTLGGTYLLSAFIQQKPFYTAQNIKVLRPKKIMSELEKLYYCFCIKSNRFKYTSHGREANSTFNDILVPAEMPDSWRNLDTKELNTLKKSPVSQNNFILDTDKWEWFNLPDLFNISASRDKLSDDLTEGGNTPYVTSSETHNGVTSFFEEDPTNKAGTITANRGGSVGYFFYQPVDYLATPVDVRILTPKFDIDVFLGLFIKTVLQLEKYRYNYSRKMGSDRLREFKIKLPSNGHIPDWDFMRNYIKSLPYSANL
jgi:hypothetical protein